MREGRQQGLFGEGREGGREYWTLNISRVFAKSNSLYLKTPNGCQKRRRRLKLFSHTTTTAFSFVVFPEKFPALRAREVGNDRDVSAVYWRTKWTVLRNKYPAPSPRTDSRPISGLPLHLLLFKSRLESHEC